LLNKLVIVANGSEGEGLTVEARFPMMKKRRGPSVVGKSHVVNVLGFAKDQRPRTNDHFPCASRILTAFPV